MHEEISRCELCALETTRVEKEKFTLLEGEMRKVETEEKAQMKKRPPGYSVTWNDNI